MMATTASMLLLALVATTALASSPKIQSQDGSIISHVAEEGDAVFHFGDAFNTSIKQLHAAIEEQSATVAASLAEVQQQTDAKLTNLNQSISEAMDENTANSKDMLDATKMELNATKMDLMQQMETLRKEVESDIAQIEEDAVNTANALNNSLLELENQAEKVSEQIKDHDEQFQHAYSILKMLVAHDGLATDSSRTELVKVAKATCHERGLGYGNLSCVDCLNGYDEDFRACRVPGFTTQRETALGRDITLQRRCSGDPDTWEHGVWPQKFKASHDGRYQIYFKFMDYRYGTSSCYGDREAMIRVYPVVDGSRRDYCQYNYVRGWGRNDNEHNDVVCDFTIDLKEGDHTVEYDIQSYGYQVIAYLTQFRATAWQRYLGKIARTPQKESDKECAKTTGNVLLRTWQKADRSGRSCGGWTGWSSFSTHFQESGPWTVTSQTGNLHIYYKTFTYLYGRVGCRSYDAGLQVRFIVDGKDTGYCDYIYMRGWYNHDNEHGQIICDFVHAVTPGKAIKIDIQAQYLGHDARLYSNSMRSAIQFEDLPPPSLSQPHSPPENCKGETHRRILHIGNMKKDFNQRNCNGGYYRITTGNEYIDRVKFTITRPKATIRVHFKAMTYMYGQTNCHGDRDVLMRLNPVIDNVRRTDCSYLYIRGWGSYDNAHRPMTCDFSITLSKGDHTIEFDLWGRGHNFVLYGGNKNPRSIYTIEEIPHDLSTSTEL